jgi:hypothetical protein
VVFAGDDHDPPLRRQRTEYDSTAEPPLLAGACHDTAMADPDAVATTFVGAEGVEVAFPIVTSVEGDDHAPAPTEFFAATRKRCSPGERPGTSALVTGDVPSATSFHDEPSSSEYSTT